MGHTHSRSAMRMRFLRSPGSVGVAIARLVGLGLLILLVLMRIADPLFVSSIRNQSFDILQRLHPRPYTKQPVVVVDIDEKSLEQVGQWPWPRSEVARLVDRLTAMGAIAIGFDIVFAEPDRLSPDRIAEDNASLPADIKAGLLALPSNEELLADAIRRSRVVVGETSVRHGESPALNADAAGRARHPRSAARSTRRRSDALPAAIPAAGPELESDLRRRRRSRHVHRRAGRGRNFPPRSAGHDGREQDSPRAFGRNPAHRHRRPGIRHARRTTPGFPASWSAGCWCRRTGAGRSGPGSTGLCGSATFPPAACCPAQRPLQASPGKWCWWAPPPSASRISGRRLSPLSCPASKSTRRSSRTY